MDDVVVGRIVASASAVIPRVTTACTIVGGVAALDAAIGAVAGAAFGAAIDAASGAAVGYAVDGAVGAASGYYAPTAAASVVV